MSKLNVKPLTLLDNISSDDIKAMLLSFLEDNEIEALKDFIQALPMVPANQWIKVSKRLPAVGVYVMVTERDGRSGKLYTNIGLHEGDNEWLVDDSNPEVISWQPMIAPDTEEEKA